MASRARSGNRVVRALLAGTAGLVAAAAGFGVYLPHALLTSVRVVDVTGALAGLVGVAFVVYAFRTGFSDTRRRTQLLAVPITLVLIQWFVIPVVGAGIAVNTTHPGIAKAATLGLSGARDVSFPATDGTRLAGWYVPGRNGAAVILLHGSHGTRASTEKHLRMLHGAGYGVLAYDARGHGDSAGQTNALGWEGADDVAGAAAFVARQPGVDRHKIAALGLSMGAEEALAAAARQVPLRAVIADGAEGATLGDSRAKGLGPLAASVQWVDMRAVELFSGDPEPTPLNEQVRRIRIPVLLIASPRERKIDTIFRSRMGPATQLWYVPDAGHTHALDAHPAGYATRVTAFLKRALR